MSHETEIETEIQHLLKLALSLEARGELRLAAVAWRFAIVLREERGVNFGSEPGAVSNERTIGEPIEADSERSRSDSSTA